MGGRLLRAKEMVHLGEHVRMGVQMQKADRLTARDLAAAQGLNDATGDRMIATNRHRPRPGFVYFAVEPGDLLDAVLVVVCARKRHIADVCNFRAVPWVYAKRAVAAPLQSRNISDRARAEVLVALCCTITGRVRHACKHDIHSLRPCIGAAEHRRDAPPVQVFHHASVVFFGHGVLLNANLKSILTKSKPQSQRYRDV